MMLIRFATCSAVATAALAAGSAHAAPLDFTVNASNELATIELEDGNVVNGSDLINVTLTDFDDTNGGTIMITPGGSSGTPADRSSVLEDLRIDTGFANPESAEFTFNTPIINRAGVDFLFFDYGGRDAFSITTPNNISINAASSDGKDVGLALSTNLRNGPNITTVQELEAADFTPRAGNPSNASRQGIIGFDLDDFGYLAGESVSFITFNDIGGSDPVLVLGVQAVPEPGSLALIGVGGLLVLTRKRRSV